MPNPIDALNDRYFDGKLPPGVLQFLDLDAMGPQARELVERSFRLMNEAGLEAHNVFPLQAFVFGKIMARQVPEAWDGPVPPITMPGRHRVIDEYIRSSPWTDMSGAGGMLDIGCGYPPVTTLETAERFPDWTITAADPGLPEFILYDERGDYAAIRADGGVQYFQPQDGSAERWGELFADTDATRARFGALFERLLPRLPDVGPDEEATVEDGDLKLVKNPARHFERSNLSITRAAIGDFQPTDMDVVRIFNVLFYFDRAFRDRALPWFGDALKPGGSLICGANILASSEARYTVYRKEGGELVEKEFAFGLECARPMFGVAHMAFVDEEHETDRLTSLLSELRSDRAFAGDLDSGIDGILSDLELGRRDAGGNMEVVNWDMPSAELNDRIARMMSRLDGEGYVDRAVDVLRAAGHDARRNEVGHIAIAPDASAPA